jgi:hypothetical protein
MMACSLLDVVWLTLQPFSLEPLHFFLTQRPLRIVKREVYEVLFLCPKKLKWLPLGLCA